MKPSSSPRLTLQNLCSGPGASWCPSALPSLCSPLLGGCSGCSLSSAKKRGISTSPTSWIQPSMTFFSGDSRVLTHLSPQDLPQLVVPKPVLTHGVFLSWYKTFSCPYCILWSSYCPTHCISQGLTLSNMVFYHQKLSYFSLGKLEPSVFFPSEDVPVW